MWNDYECAKLLTDSLWSMVAFISPCPSSRSIAAQNQPLVRASLWRLKIADKKLHQSEWYASKWGVLLMISCSAKTLPVGGWEIQERIFHLLQSRRTLLPHSTPADKWWNSYASPDPGQQNQSDSHTDQLGKISQHHSSTWSYPHFENLFKTLTCLCGP